MIYQCCLYQIQQNRKVKMKTKSKPKSKFVKILVICVIILICIFVVAFLIRNSKKSENQDNQTFTVRKEVFENVIEISGNISAAESQTLQAAGEGTVQKVYVKEGDFVKKGQVIMELDAVEQRYNLAKHEYSMEQTRINGAQRELELMEHQRQVLKNKITDRMVTAYFDGIIVQLSVSEGDVVEAKDEVGTIINRDYMSASVEIVENDVHKLKKGQIVKFTFPAYEDLEVTGYVDSFPAVGRITSRGATVVDAVVKIDNPPEEILPNFSFTGEIEITPPKNYLVVERSAIGHRGGKSFAEKILPDGSVQAVDVQIEPYGFEFVNVISGLEEGDVLKNQGGGLKSGKLRTNSQRGNPGQNKNSGGMRAPSGMSGGMPPAGMPGGRP